VTLEPCSARDAAKKQPPCLDALLRAKVRRVVIGELDPDPRHSGRALEELRRAGIEVVVAPAGSVPERLLADFRSQLRSSRPWVILKWAQGLDGRWDSPPGERWLSSEESRTAVHRLRAHVDAVLVGSGTVIADDPRLTARPPGRRPLVRIALDARARVSPASQLFTSEDGGPVWWVTARGAKAKVPRGVERLELTSPHALAQEVLPELRRRGVRRLLVEGGPTIAAAFLRENAVDRACVFVAPLLRGAGGGAPALGLGAAELPSATKPRVEGVERSGCDALFKLSWS
jgi:diaminohydroxyphosphoribosylaminopyrimidine deaminase/5-amino-6-(5-phosphoribosylamino)uracil reductase